MRQLIIGLILAIGLTAGTAMAADEEGRYRPKGFGLASCEQFVGLVEEQSTSLRQFVGWVEGYMTAYNQMAEDTFDVAAWEKPNILARYLYNYCRQNPSGYLGQGMNAVIEVLKPGRISAREQLVEAQSGDQSVWLYPSVLNRVQEALKAEGMYDGEIDGTFNEDLQFALAEFQQAQGMSVSGLPDQNTLHFLLREPKVGDAIAP